MRRLSLSDTALQDLADIADHIVELTGDERHGLTIVDALIVQCEKLATLPGTMGRPRPELLPELRSFPFRGYVIFFRYTEEAIEVANILSGRRDLESYFGLDED